MGRKIAEVNPGDIFMIPLFLPSYQGAKKEELLGRIDYSKYKFRMDDIYAFGRVIEIQAGRVDLIEVFSYTGQIPQNPEKIIHSGRMFAPEHIGHSVFEKGRWQIIFSNPHYDMWKDSDYENISFLSPVGHMWKGKKEIKITKEKCIELEEAGIPYWTMHGGVDLEVRIRSVLEAQGGYS